MTGKPSRPDLARIETAADSYDGTILDAEHAHLFGVGMSELESRATVRRGLASLAECWPQVVAQMARRMMIQAMVEALPPYWLTRSERLSQIGTPWADAAALACRRHAWLLSQQPLAGELQAEVDDLLGVV